MRSREPDFEADLRGWLVNTKVGPHEWAPSWEGRRSFPRVMSCSFEIQVQPRLEEERLVFAFRGHQDRASKEFSPN
jgi:hypothetical protein